MHKKLFYIMSVLLALVLLTSTVIAASPRLKDPRFVDDSATFYSDVVGRGNKENLYVTMELEGSANMACISDENDAPFRYTARVYASNTAYVGEGVVVAVIDTGIEYEKQCPNNNFLTKIIGPVYFERVEVRLFDDDGITHDKWISSTGFVYGDVDLSTG